MISAKSYFLALFCYQRAQSKARPEKAERKGARKPKSAHFVQVAWRRRAAQKALVSLNRPVGRLQTANLKLQTARPARAEALEAARRDCGRRKCARKQMRFPPGSGRRWWSKAIDSKLALSEPCKIIELWPRRREGRDQWRLLACLLASHVVCQSGPSAATSWSARRACLPLLVRYRLLGGDY